MRYERVLSDDPATAWPHTQQMMAATQVGGRSHQTGRLERSTVIQPVLASRQATACAVPYRAARRDGIPM